MTAVRAQVPAEAGIDPSAETGTDPSVQPAAGAEAEAPDDRPLPAAVCVLGLGLIGGSLMRAVASRAPGVPVFGWSPGEETRAAAEADGFEVAGTVEQALRRAAATDALVVLAAPVTAFAALLDHVDEIAPTALLTDVGGVKGPVADLVGEHAPHARYVGSHPMAGTQHSGWAAGSGDLFSDRIWVTTLDEDARLANWLPVAGLALTVGSRVVPCEPAAHDDAAARISHLPHLLAAALAQVGAAGGPLALSLAAGSFTDGTRVAATRPALVRAMCETNAGPLLDALDDALGLIGVARGSLASSGSLAKIAAGGFAARADFEHRFDALAPVTMSGTDLVEQLLAVGSSGGYVTDVTAGPAGVAVRAMFPWGDPDQ